ncbi:MAG: hypothetical protein IKU86_09045 [Thermoguttaceae bacterium]|nr:hypothetical protein [Thermoguttaceae bacterium]
MKTDGLRKKKREQTLEPLASAVDDATRASARASAFRWGEIALWSASGVGVFACFANGFDCLANVLIACSTWSCVVVFGALGAARAFRRRPTLFQAARRWERRFPEIAGILTAAVDFFEESGGNATDSSALRRATVETAIRRFEDSARTLDETERRAVLADAPPEKLRDIGKTRGALALGAAVSWGVLGGAGALSGWEKADVAPKIASTTRKSEQAAPPLKKFNEPNGVQTTKFALKEEDKQNGEGFATEENDFAAVENAEISVATLELLSGELARNAEIARTLEAELRGFSGERTEGSETAVSLLFLARELKTNFERPERGVDAQIRRLRTAARRETDAIWARFGESGALNKKNGRERENVGEKAEKGSAEADERGARKTTLGRETAVFLLTARLERWEAERWENESGYDAASRALNVALRSDSTEERTQAAKSAALVVGRWATLLRQEETALRILTESWRFDAAALDGENALSRAAEENNALLARFAGRSALEPVEDEDCKAGKRRIAAFLDAARAATDEQVAIFERLRERLRSEDGADFVAFLERTVESERENVATNRAALDAVDDWAARWEKRRALVGQSVENNRFGKAASALQIFVEPARIEANEPLGEESDSADAEETRFAASALRLTFGAGVASRQALALNEETLAAVGVPLKRATGEGGDPAARSDGETETVTRRNGAPTDVRSGGENESATATFADGNQEKTTDWSGAASGENRNFGTAGETVVGVGTSVGENASGVETGCAQSESALDGEVVANEAFSGELPSEARSRFEGTRSPRVAPEYEEKVRLYRRRIANERGNDGM